VPETWGLSGNPLTQAISGVCKRDSDDCSGIACTVRRRDVPVKFSSCFDFVVKKNNGRRSELNVPTVENLAL
jgi:hypothetical protein